MYTIHYLDGDDRVRKTEGGFDTLETIHKNYVLISVRKDGRSVLSVIAGTIDDIAALGRNGLLSTDEPNQESGDRLPGMV